SENLPEIQMDSLPERAIAYSFAPDTKTRFVNTRYINNHLENEIRNAAFAFANLAEIHPTDQNLAIAKLSELAHSFGGLINKLETAASGLVVFILFGMPRTEGNTLERICRFALEIQREIPHIAVSISAGAVFAGYVGSGNIREYTALGLPVNIAARLLSLAKPGMIVAENQLYQQMNESFSFAPMRKSKIKGLAEPVICFELLKRTAKIKSGLQNPFVGRREEYNFVLNCLETCYKDRSNCQVFILGDAGLGKSRLADEVMQNLSDADYQKFFLACDSVMPKPLETLRQLLRQYFSISASSLPEQSINDFRAKWKSLAGNDDELIRIESIIASLLGLSWKSSIWSLIPPDEKTAQMINAMTLFAERISQDKPLLVRLDDIQWLDETSINVFAEICDSPRTRIRVIACSRYNA
ncbi:MAG: adenylate/guanylate cyclase domain-containing protein, partial [Candidatus Cloacimonadaceae bacterium]|nr:adenylate/guanylate cyclase domain-containing protein [Candidatus Cloacimonadaceae bacterium]